MNRQKPKRLGDLLVNSGMITEEQLQQALAEKEPGQKLGDVLLQKGYITELQLVEVLEFQLGIPHVSLYNYPFDISLTKLITKDFAKRNSVIPLKKEGGKLFVAMVDPMDYFVINDLRLTTGFTIEPVIATKDDIIRSLNKLYDIEEFDEEWMEDHMIANTAVENIEDGDSPIVKLVNQLIQQAIVQNASDIHLDPQEQKIVVRFRVDGTLRTERLLPKQIQAHLITRVKIMANLNITEQRLPQDGRIKVDLDFRKVDLRISTLPTIFGEKIVIRILDFGSTINDIEQLGFSNENLARFMQMLKKPHGIILITGPTGSGKTSTMYSALNILNDEKHNIITIEDPVEYQIDGINQIQINPKIGLTFATGLRAILRQDPNIIMIGEIRDLETAEMAIRAAMTGHLVFSTLHTNDAIGTIGRLKDLGIEPFLIGSSLSGVLSQRLIRKICRDCKESVEPSEREKQIFSQHGINLHHVYRGKGCPTCHMTGYKGRTAIHEVLEMSEEIRNGILNVAQMSEIRDIAIKNGFNFLFEDGLMKVAEGITTTEELLRVALE
ncbi:ATPase, T2SS/T4P/T4SS family [Bacillus sp. FJAT-47783]|uniref:GspE/PulE family protein n=1 Tax=Bacillus sp. FJAT-47783 TaxID=2922712 RepID=UPI001FABAA82|nr:ATPase, T2SS/T4P/T4SS family [Bacillus sp. FJAT-47783]